MRRVLAVGAWLSLAVTLIAWLMVRAGDEWAPATFLMFGPRWLFAVPPTILVIPVAIVQRRLLWPTLAAGFLAIGPLMGFNVPWDRMRDAPTGGPRMRVVTCNMHYGRVAPVPLKELLIDAQPDVVAIQEWRHSNRDFLPDADWHMSQTADCVLVSRFPIRTAEVLGDNSDHEQAKIVRYELETPSGPVTLASMHLASPRHELKQAAMARSSGLSELESNTALRAKQSSFVLKSITPVAGPVLLVGDFNTPPESALFRDSWSGYRDAFADAGWGWGYTFTNRWTRVRIDHILVRDGGRATSCWVGPDIGSPHRPVIADVAWPTPPPNQPKTAVPNGLAPGKAGTPAD